ncbi:unnamed protein product [Bursaphelenchus xylophilus]|uniref:(pine wood nematode) hypothetical protein n=1 Tax=Bursaphelenchus xylophilus TaxID=6326 RepID=A0A1I7S8M3_BURXY|nr:unnamed protein product [Bursaphelenchus xylophilus]CAG9089500.1 unnamed protein product [Bursaphelenchus xylophilus]
MTIFPGNFAKRYLSAEIATAPEPEILGSAPAPEPKVGARLPSARAKPNAVAPVRPKRRRSATYRLPFHDSTNLTPRSATSNSPRTPSDAPTASPPDSPPAHSSENSQREPLIRPAADLKRPNRNRKPPQPECGGAGGERRCKVRLLDSAHAAVVEAATQRRHTDRNNPYDSLDAPTVVYAASVDPSAAAAVVAAASQSPSYAAHTPFAVAAAASTPANTVQVCPVADGAEPALLLKAVDSRPTAAHSAPPQQQQQCEADAVPAKHKTADLPATTTAAADDIPPATHSAEEHSHAEPDDAKSQQKSSTLGHMLLKLLPCNCSMGNSQGLALHNDVAGGNASNIDLDDKTNFEEVAAWGVSFDRLMKHKAGQKYFAEFLKGEYSDENILFWQACEELKRERNTEKIEEKARIIYEDFISILSPKEVSLDSRVREIINNNMIRPTAHTFDEAQNQIYTLMQRDSYPRFIASPLYKQVLSQYGHMEEL